MITSQRHQRPIVSASKTTPSVVFLCPAQWGIRNVAHSGMIEALRARGIRVHLLTGKPESYALWYPELRGSGTVESNGHYQIDVTAGELCSELHTPHIVRSERGMSALRALHSAAFFRRYDIATDRVYKWWFNRDDSRWEKTRDTLAAALATIMSRDRLFHGQAAYIERRKRQIWNLAPMRQQLETLQPSLVIATSCVMWAEEPYLMVARDMKIPTVGCIQSFDSLTSRSFIPKCDHYVVWNQRMHDQVRRFYPERAAAAVHVTGTPQFDFHINSTFRWSREATLAHLGLNAHDRYILYAANFYFHTPTEPRLVADFIRTCAQTPELRDHRIVVRLHPLDDYERWNALVSSSSQVVISRPSEHSRSFASPDDQARLVSSLLHADVTINMWSTMSLDSAIVDTPVVCVAFASEHGSLEDQFCRQSYLADFYRPIVESGGVRMAYALDQLVTEVAAYARDPARDREARQRMVSEECGQVDGRVAERVADLIGTLVERHESRAHSS